MRYFYIISLVLLFGIMIVVSNKTDHVSSLDQREGAVLCFNAMLKMEGGIMGGDIEKIEYYTGGDGVVYRYKKDACLIDMFIDLRGACDVVGVSPDCPLRGD